ncbi:hypothetical protein KJ596_03775 [Patescibacteria group bacterium]|nr:hypothetical protein [Patescibacteria group bacterium]MBU1868394.1 hypothetical protein [Patescibacteria group bacterium]
MQFSEEEIQQLIRAWISISLAFAIIFARRFVGLGILSTFALSCFTVGISFVLHELAHKYLAQRNGCWAEFRAFDAGLVLAVVMAWIGGFVFAAPGVVAISGSTTDEESGKIAAGGPLTNIILAVMFIVAGRVFRPILLASYYQGLSVWLFLFFAYGQSVNSWLAFFNLLPFGIMDGSKIKNWNSTVWGMLTLTALILVFFV